MKTLATEAWRHRGKISRAGDEDEVFRGANMGKDSRKWHYWEVKSIERLTLGVEWGILRVEWDPGRTNRGFLRRLYSGSNSAALRTYAATIPKQCPQRNLTGSMALTLVGPVSNI